MTRDRWVVLQYVFGALTCVCAYLSLVLGTDVNRLYFLGFAPAAIFGILTYVSYRKVRERKTLAVLRAEWGQKKEIESAPLEEVIRALFGDAPKPDHAIDDRTWTDLTMDVVFTQIDRTLTIPGKQVLYQILRTPCLENTEELIKRAQLIKIFEEEQELREQVQLVLHRVGHRIGRGLSRLLWSSHSLQAPAYGWLYTLMYIAALLSPLALLTGSQGVSLIVVLFFTNMGLHYREQKRNQGYFESIKALASLVRSGEKICELDADWGSLTPMIDDLRAALQKVKRFKRVTTNIDVESSDPLLGTITQYYAIFFLREVRSFVKAVGFITREREAFQKVFHILGTLDACQAAASYRASLPYYCEPQFVDHGQYDIREAYHPLVENCVPNSIQPEKRGILVTGSNMSGKSTFLRTIGISTLLAQTIYTVPARSYRAPILRIITSIGRSDNVVEGRSYYLEEALAVLRVIKSLDSKYPMLCIFDELYRGTNSEERIAAAYRVIRYIAERNAMIFTATHDLELTEMLTPICQNFHFSEKVSDIGLEFDYKLKPGPAVTRNAIALLRYLGYPAEITDPKIGE